MTLHQRRTHSTPVEGCFGCKASGLILSVPRHMSWKNEDAQAEHMAAATQLMAKNPDRYAPAGSRWV